MITWTEPEARRWCARPTTHHAECEGEVRAEGNTVRATVWRHDRVDPMWTGERVALWTSEVPALVRAARTRVETEMQRLM